MPTTLSQPQITVLYGTGRCGTAMLTQYFGGISKDLHDWRRVGNNLIAHEPFDELEDYWKMVMTAKQGKATHFVEEFLLPAIKSQGGCENCLITDNKIGRWFYEELQASPLPTRLIYIHRNREEVIASMKKRTKVIKDLFWCHQASDANPLTPVIDPYEFHIAETLARWEKLRPRLAPSEYIDVSYERFISDRTQRQALEEFVGMPGMEELVERKTNAAENDFKP